MESGREQTAFTTHPQSVKRFTEIGMEPNGRIGSGVMELISAILIRIPGFTGYGAILGLMMMAGALYFHPTELGINFDGDPILFIYSVITFVCCAGPIFVYKNQL